MTNLLSYQFELWTRSGYYVSDSLYLGVMCFQWRSHCCRAFAPSRRCQNWRTSFIFWVSMLKLLKTHIHCLNVLHAVIVRKERQYDKYLFGTISMAAYLYSPLHHLTLLTRFFKNSLLPEMTNLVQWGDSWLNLEVCPKKWLSKILLNLFDPQWNVFFFF